VVWIVLLTPLAFVNALYLLVWFARRALGLERMNRERMGFLFGGTIGALLMIVGMLGTLISVVAQHSDVMKMTLLTALGAHVALGALIIQAVNSTPSSLGQGEEKRQKELMLICWFVTGVITIGLIAIK
jgi:hypothetical protein